MITKTYTIAKLLYKQGHYIDAYNTTLSLLKERKLKLTKDVQNFINNLKLSLYKTLENDKAQKVITFIDKIENNLKKERDIIKDDLKFNFDFDIYLNRSFSIKPKDVEFQHYSKKDLFLENDTEENYLNFLLDKFKNLKVKKKRISKLDFNSINLDFYISLTKIYKNNNFETLRVIKKNNLLTPNIDNFTPLVNENRWRLNHKKNILKNSLKKINFYKENRIDSSKELFKNYDINIDIEILRVWEPLKKVFEESFRKIDKIYIDQTPKISSNKSSISEINLWRKKYIKDTILSLIGNIDKFKTKTQTRKNRRDLEFLDIKIPFNLEIERSFKKLENRVNEQPKFRSKKEKLLNLIEKIKKLSPRDRKNNNFSDIGIDPKIEIISINEAILSDKNRKENYLNKLLKNLKKEREDIKRESNFKDLSLDVNLEILKDRGEEPIVYISKPLDKVEQLNLLLKKIENYKNTRKNDISRKI